MTGCISRPGPRKKKPVKEKEPFYPSGIRQQGFFLPMVFPSLNEYTKAATQTFGSKGHRGTMAANIKRRMETTIRLQIRLAKLLPMEHAFIFLTYYELGRNRNKDNIAATAKKFLLDALQDQGILRNDGWKEIVNWNEHFKVTPGTPGVHVEFYDPLQMEAEIELLVQSRHRQALTDWKRLIKEISR